jgi:hypothetical protein
MTMKTIVVTMVTALLASAAPAAPQRVKLPNELLGKWCLVRADSKNESTAFYRRGSCKKDADEWLRITPNGYDVAELGCTTVKSNMTGGQPVASRAYQVWYRCGGEGFTWTERKLMWLTPKGLGTSTITATEERPD